MPNFIHDFSSQGIFKNRILSQNWKKRSSTLIFFPVQANADALIFAVTAGNAYTYTIPSCLAAGSYIVRHEIIALHSAGEYPGVQFYPSCHQIQVTGSGTSTGPTSKVSIPGLYAPTDPGITYNMYIAQTYTIPGPTLFTCWEYEMELGKVGRQEGLLNGCRKCARGNGGRGHFEEIRLSQIRVSWMKTIYAQSWTLFLVSFAAVQRKRTAELDSFGGDKPVIGLSCQSSWSFNRSDLPWI